jgi:LacI family transcriptional regulator
MTPEAVAAAVGKAFESLFALPSPPTAIFAANDGLALVVSDIALRRGMVLPAQLGIGGFDDIFMASHAAVPLTTVRQDFRAIGREALRLSLSRGRGGRRTRDRTFPVELIVRGSVVRGSVVRGSVVRRSVAPTCGTRRG